MESIKQKASAVTSSSHAPLPVSNALSPHRPPWNAVLSLKMQSASKKPPSLSSLNIVLWKHQTCRRILSTVLPTVSAQCPLSLFVVVFPSKRAQLSGHPPTTVRWSLIDSGARRYLKPEEGTLSCFECHRSLFVLDDASSASCFLAGGRLNWF